jgi:hypothetical protein
MYNTDGSFYEVALFLELHPGTRFVVHNRQSVCKAKWVSIRRGNRVCYAQWEDVGPFRTDNWQYVFGNERPRPNRRAEQESMSIRPFVTT